MKKIILFNLLCMVICIKSQNNLRLYSADGSLFRIYINDKLYSPNAQASIMLSDIKKDTLYLKVEFNNQDRLGMSVYLMDKGKATKNKEFNYKLNIINHKLKVEFTGLYDAILLPSPLVPKAPVTDSSRWIKSQSLNGFCEQQGKESIRFFTNIPKSGSCLVAMPSEYLNFATTLITKAGSTEEKQAWLESICQNNCLSVTQLNTFLSYLSNDLDKLKLVRVARPNLVDTLGKNKLAERFQSAFSVAELATVLKTTPPAPKQAAGCGQASLHEEVVKLTTSLNAPENDLQRLALFKKNYSYYCYNFNQASLIIEKFHHDRERLEAAKFIYNYCVEKDKFSRECSHLFNHQQTVNEFMEFIAKATR